MGYTRLKNKPQIRNYDKYSLEDSALTFIREACEGLRFSAKKEAQEDPEKGIYFGASLKENEIPYNMQMDIDRLCLEKAVEGFLESGKKEDAFNVYFCYLEMFVGDYEKTRRMIELLSEFEANGSGLLMKHRDHYSHSVYVFVLGLAIYQTNSIYRNKYNRFYGLTDEHQAACHYLEYWGLASLFHDIGYPFELPFEQVASYFEVDGDDRAKRPFVAYHALDSFVKIDKVVAKRIAGIYYDKRDAFFETTDELFAYVLSDKLSATYLFTKEQMLRVLKDKPAKPNKYNHFMDHAYFSATVLFKKLFCEMECELRKEHMDALTAILMHNSLYKFSIANYKDKRLNIPFKAELHPLAYMLMLCDELQCWDRTAYGRSSKKELHPMGCKFDLANNTVRATYLYDKEENGGIKKYRKEYVNWQNDKPDESDKEQYAFWKERKPKLKAYSGMHEKNKGGISDFQEDIERIVDLTKIKLAVDVEITEKSPSKKRSYLSESNFINLYNFAVVLNGRWDNADWKEAKELEAEEEFLSNENNIKKFTDSFKKLSLEYKLSNINQAKAFAEYMDTIGCFYTDKAVDFDILKEFTSNDLVEIGKLEHRRWLQEHYDMGWEYGTPEKEERELVRLHKDMIPEFDHSQETVLKEQAEANYKRLDKEEQDKDTEPMECILAMLRMFEGVRIYKLRER